MSDVFVVSAVRTPISKFLGGLSSLPAPKLGAIVIREAVKRAGLAPDEVGECLMGCVLQAGLGQIAAAQAIKAGDLDAAVAGGMESMSNAPYLLPDARRGSRLGHARMLDAMIL